MCLGHIIAAFPEGVYIFFLYLCPIFSLSHLFSKGNWAYIQLSRFYTHIYYVLVGSKYHFLFIRPGQNESEVTEAELKLLKSEA